MAHARPHHLLVAVADDTLSGKEELWGIFVALRAVSAVEAGNDSVFDVFL